MDSFFIRIHMESIDTLHGWLYSAGISYDPGGASSLMQCPGPGSRYRSSSGCSTTYEGMSTADCLLVPKGSTSALGVSTRSGARERERGREKNSRSDPNLVYEISVRVGFRQHAEKV